MSLKPKKLLSRRLLIVASKTGYQIRAFGEAAVRAGLEPAFASDRCRGLDNPWRDGAIAVRFHDEAASVAAIVEATRARPVAGVLALGDRPSMLAAAAARPSACRSIRPMVHTPPETNGSCASVSPPPACRYPGIGRPLSTRTLWRWPPPSAFRAC